MFVAALAPAPESPFVRRMKADLLRLDDRYETQFARRARGKHSLVELDELLAGVRSVLEQIERIPKGARGGELEALRAAARKRLARFEDERVNVARFQTMSGADEAFTRHAYVARTVYLRVARHLSEHPPTHRDLGLLEEMHESLDRARHGMGALTADVGRASASAALDAATVFGERLQAEIAATRAARSDEAPSARARRVAELATAQYTLYETHFSSAGTASSTSRVLSSPRFLARIVGNLTRLAREARGLEETGAVLADLPGRLERYERELDALRKERAEVLLPHLFRALGAAAIERIAAYEQEGRGADTEAQLAALGAVCDALHECRRELIDIGTALGIATADDDSLWAITVRLRRFEEEHAMLRRQRDDFRTACVTT